MNVYIRRNLCKSMELFFGIILQLLQMPPSSSIYDFLGADRVALINLSQLVAVLLFSSIVTYFVVIAKYRDIYSRYLLS